VISGDEPLCTIGGDAASVLAGATSPGLRLLLGRAFLVALGRKDRDIAIVFARALLTQLPPVAPQRP